MVSKRFLVLSALAVLLVLGGSLGLRLMGGENSPAPPVPEVSAMEQDPGPPPAAYVLETMAMDPLSLEPPDWSAVGVENRSLEFTVDLDAIAPLGDGPGNAALWFRQFAKHDGARLAEMTEALSRMIDDDGKIGKHLPGDDPLLLEAEPWVDQATMRFYPDVWEANGYDTAITNLLMMIHFSRSWAARGAASEDPDAAREDYRRIVRLGRLLRQEDAVLITDLVGLYCIRIGLEMLYDLEREERNLSAAMLAGMALGEAAPLRLITQALITDCGKARLVKPWHRLGYDVDVREDDLQRIVWIAENHPDRSIRGEAILTLHMVSTFGSGETDGVARTTLEGLAETDDPMISGFARWALSRDFPPEIALYL